MNEGGSLAFRIRRALTRARFGILTVGFTYVLAVAIGLTMVHTGNRFALHSADRLVARAWRTSSILHALDRGETVRAAAMDCAANLMAGVASTLSGYWAPAVYPIALYRGWIGGIVGVDRKHRSRLARASEAVYYLVTIILQLIPYILAGGAGVNLGLARIRPLGDYSGPKFFAIPREAIRDAARIYLLVIPLFAIASAFEFLAIPS